MEKDAKITENQKKNSDKPWLFKKGQSGNPAGKPRGTLDFKTKWLRFIEKIAEQNNITPEEVDEKMLAVAYKQILNGNFPFYKDIHDRIYGKAPEKIEITPDEESEKNAKEIEDLSNKFNEFLKRFGRA
jgi:DNA-directed RNA polymerase specialized sigma subunit